MWSIFWSQKISVTVMVINLEALALFLMGWFALAVGYALAGAAIAWTFHSNAERG